MKSKKIVIIVFFITTVFSNLLAQNIDKNSTIVISNARIDSLLQLHIEYNNKYPTF